MTIWSSPIAIDDTRSRACGFTLIELLVVITISSIVMGVLASGFIVGAKTAAAANTRLRESHDAQLATAYFVADASSATYFSTTTPPPLAPCSLAGLAPVALFQLVQAGVTKDVFYVVTGAPLQLVRRYCDSNSVKYDVSLVKNLSAVKTPIATCPPATTNCGTEPDHVQLQVWETSGYTFTLRATRRSATSTGPASGVISAYVGGGGVTLLGISKLSSLIGVVDVNSPNVTCSPAATISSPAGSFVANLAPPPPPTCAGTTATNPLSDPLAGLPVPPVPAAVSGSANLKTCGFTGPTYQPGLYTTWTSPGAGSPGCLATGVYHLPAGALLDHVTAQGTFSDGKSNTTTKYTSAHATFTVADIGKTIAGRNIPANTTISAVVNATTVTISAAATGTATGLGFSILNRDGMFADGVANKTTTYTSATAIFTKADIGKTIVGANIPLDTTISTVTSTTKVTLSAAATGAASSLKFTILDRAGVLIYVATGALTVGQVYLGPLASGPDTGLTILMGRASSGTITSTNTSTVNGIIYAAAGSLSLQTGVSLIAGAVNVGTLSMASGSSVVLP